MKKFFMDIRQGFEKDIVTASIESGVDAIIANDEDIKKIKSLGLIKVISKNGDLKLGKDLLELEIKDKKEEKEAIELVKSHKLLLRIKDWKIIPLEDLIASNSENVFCFVKNFNEAKIAVSILEKGVAGVVLETKDINEIKKVSELIKRSSEKLNLVKIKIVKTKQLGVLDRVCIDTCTNMKGGEGMLVGNTSSGFFLVHSESLETPYCDPRPFRVNAGAVHAYIKLSNDKTKYLADLKTGNELLIVDKDGNTHHTNLGRAKIEKRPMILVEGDYKGKKVTLIMQNAETIRLTNPDGKAISIIALKEGDEVLGFVDEGGRHFGMKIKETIIEK